MKTFGLMFCQLLIVLAISAGLLEISNWEREVAIDYLQVWKLLAPNMGSTPAQACIRRLTHGSPGSLLHHRGLEFRQHYGLADLQGLA